MKVIELEGAQLDFWVARAEGMSPKIIKGHCYCEASEVANGGLGYYQPSKDWSQAGPIIEREGITICESARDYSGQPWMACIGFSVWADEHEWINGGTMLIAAMRAFVASKFGEEVPDAGSIPDPESN